MNTNVFSLDEEDIFSDKTYKKNYHLDSKTNSYDNSSCTNSSLKNTSNFICQKIILNVNQNKKNSASFPLISINKENQIELPRTNIYTQKIILKSINSRKNSNLNKSNEIIVNNNENENDNKNKYIQHIILKSLNKNKEEKIKKGINENYKNIEFNTNNIIRVIVSNEKLMKNFPVEYLNEMVSDLCSNLYQSKYNYIKLIQTKAFIDYKTFLEKRMSLFNLILRLSMNSKISETTLFLTYNIFDRYISLEKSYNDDLLLIIIVTSFCIAIKYAESNVPNLEELCTICGNKFSKENIKKCELNIMEKLNYNISIPTIYDLYQFIKVLKNMTTKDFNLGLFILEMFIISGGELKYNNLIIIEAIYLIILETNGKEKIFLNLYNYISNSNINTFKYNEEINNCFLNIKEECLHIKDNNFFYLIKKFANEKYEKISIDFQLL